jgi:integrase
VWSPEQLATFLDAAAIDRLGAVFVVAAVTGMRRGELAGLRGSDVDLDSSTIHVRHAHVQYGAAIHAKEPKTAGSRRAFTAVDPRAIVALRELRRRQREEQLAAGAAWHGGTYVLSDEIGRPLRPDAITKGMARIVAAVGLPKLTPHGLRHTFATTGLHAGVDAVYVAKLLGHSSPVTTTTVYQHALPTATAEAHQRVTAALLGG